MVEFYKYFQGLTKYDVLNLDTTRGRRTRGHNFRIVKKRFRTEAGANLFSNFAVNEWNELPQGVVDAPSVDAFKARLDIFWKNKEWKYEYRA